MPQSSPMEKEGSTFKKLLRKTKKHGSRGSDFLGDDTHSSTTNSSPRSSVRYSKGSMSHSMSMPTNLSSQLKFKANNSLNLNKPDLTLPEISPVRHSRKHSRSPLRSKFLHNRSQTDFDSDGDDDDDDDDEMPILSPHTLTVSKKFVLPQLKVTKAATLDEKEKEEEKRKTALRLIGKSDLTLPQVNASSQHQKQQQQQTQQQPSAEGKDAANTSSTSTSTPTSTKQQQQTGILSSIMNSISNLRSFNDLSELKSENETVELTESINLASPVSPARQVKDVSFKPLKESAFSTIGKGGLSLDNFPIQQERAQEDIDTSPLSQAPRAPLADSDYPLSPGDAHSVSVLDTSSMNGGDIVGTRPFKLAPKGSKPLSPVRSTSFRRMNSPARLALVHPNNTTTDDETTISQNGLGLRKKLRRSIKEKRNSFDASTPIIRLSTSHNTEELNEYADVLKKKADMYASRLGIKLPNEKRQDSFHQLFPNIPHNELLIEDFTCAYRKDILIQGKMYLSETHVSFHSGIIGLSTHFVVPLSKVLSVKKKKTIGIPNAMQFSTLHDKYNFASIIARDAVYDIVQKVRKGSSDLSDFEPEEEDADSQYVASDYSDYSDDEAAEGVNFPSQGGNTGNGTGKAMSTTDGDNNNNAGSNDMKKIVADNDSVISDEENMVIDDGSEDRLFNGIPYEGPKEHAPTSNEYDNDPADIKISEESLNAPLGVVFGLLFGNDTSFLKTIVIAQKNINISAIPVFDSDKHRKYSYTKPLNAPVGPKQTKCFVTESIERNNFDKNVLVTQFTETPDVPSGNSFKVKTKILLNWGPNNTTKLYVATNVVWSGKSWIKGAVEKGSISGQKESIGILIQELKKKIQAGGGASKTKKKSKKKGREGLAEEVREEETVPVVVVEPPKELSWLEYLQQQMDFKTVMMLILFILVIWDMRSRTDYSSGSVCYSNGGHGSMFEPNSSYLMKSQAELWEWIDSRHSVYNGASDNKVGSLKDQKLKEVISVLEQRLEGLRQASGG